MTIKSTIVSQGMILRSDMDGTDEIVFQRGTGRLNKVFNSSPTKTLYYRTRNNPNVTCTGHEDADGFVAPMDVAFIEFAGSHVAFKWVEESGELVFVAEVY